MSRFRLFRELADCKTSEETAAQCVARLYWDTTSPMHAAADEYVRGIRYGYRDSNPKIDFYRAGRDPAAAYAGSSNWFATCRDALVYQVVNHPSKKIVRAYRGRN